MTEIIGSSKFKPDDAYGQNGDKSPSSVPTRPQLNLINPAAQSVKPRDALIADPDATGFQTRTVSAAPLPTAFGHKNPNASSAKIPHGNNRAVQQIAPRGNARRGS
jgi:hypothetical protein